MRQFSEECQQSMFRAEIRNIYQSKLLRPSANKDSNCWGQDISSSYSKIIENTRLSLCFFKTMVSKENMLKISW